MELLEQYPEQALGRCEVGSLIAVVGLVAVRANGKTRVFLPGVGSSGTWEVPNTAQVRVIEEPNPILTAWLQRLDHGDK